METFLKNFLIVPLFLFSFKPANAYIDNDNAVVRVIDKTAGKTQTITISVGQSAQVGKLTILPQACKQTDPFQAQDYFVFLEISETDNGKIFSGWMSRNNPGQNPLQNPDYDVWLVTCE